jgi:hypothetical protein
MSLLARCGSFQRLGSSACRFSSTSRARALSTSKMPPQQSDGLLDLLDDGDDFGTHGNWQISGVGKTLSMAGTATAA